MSFGNWRVSLDADMRPIRHTISIAEATRLVLQAAAPIERTEQIGVAGADGRVTARTIVATADVPPFDRAMMDGFAVIADDTIGAGRATPSTLECIGTVYTGEMPSRGIMRGQCLQIATGAPLPDGATAVVMVEETERSGDAVRVLSPVSPRQHVAQRGADLQSGQVVLERGAHLTPARLGALAAAGVVEIEVYARPTVAILSTGNELVEPGTPLAPAQIYDINRYTLAAVAAAHGATAVTLPTAPDALDELTHALEQAAVADVVLFSGGSSVGDKDLILDVIARAGVVLFHGIAVKPGKPTIFGQVGGTPIFGMPGNPTSCLSNAYLLLIPLLRRIARLPEYRPHTIRAPLARRIVSTTGRHQFYTVRLVEGAVMPAFKSSGDITSMSQADGYIEIPADVGILEAGEPVEIKLF